MAAKNFTLPDGKVMSARDAALNIYLAFVKDEPKEVFSRMRRLIEPELSVEQRAKFEIDFLAKMKLYSEADTLGLLIAVSQKDPRYEPLLKEFEKIIFSHFATQDFAEKFAAIKAAMVDIQRHLEKPLPTWAIQWFAKIGHNETNPATLMALIRMFAASRETVLELLRKIQPV